MYILRTIIGWGWCPIVITALALVGFILEWDLLVLAPILVIILAIGLVIAVVKTKEKQLELYSQRLRQLARYFNRRFAGNSSISIFTIIDTLFSIDNPELWDWARSCDMVQRIFNNWCDSFIDRSESDIGTRKFNVYLRIYLDELWLMNTHYYEFIEQFYEVAQKVEIPKTTIEQYNRLVTEYNAFTQDFRDNISGLKKVARTEIEPPRPHPPSNPFLL
jgi:hypothetical protein